MREELDRAKSFRQNKQYDKALEILLELEKKFTEESKLILIEVSGEIYENYKLSGNYKSALDYCKKYTAEEYEKTVSENKEKTDKLDSALKIHASQKETELQQEKNNELQKANEELNQLREKKNELLEIVSEELKLPIVSIEGISVNYFHKIKTNEAIDEAEIKKDLGIIESLSHEILKNVNSILEKNKEEYKA